MSPKSILYIYKSFILKEREKKRNKVREKEKKSQKYIENKLMYKKIQFGTGIKAAGINCAAVRAHI